MKRNQGVTLIELLVTISIAVILMTVAVPGFQTLMTSNRLSSITTEFMGTINLARSEAIKRGLPAVICHSSNGSTCGGSWSDGWIIFVDADADGVKDAGETLVRVYGPMASGYTANAADAGGTAVTQVSYARNGTTANTGTFVFCKDSDESTAQAIVVTLARPRIATDGNDVGTVPEKEDGNNIGTCETP